MPARPSSRTPPLGAVVSSYLRSSAGAKGARIFQERKTEPERIKAGARERRS